MGQVGSISCWVSKFCIKLATPEGECLNNLQLSNKTILKTEMIIQIIMEYLISKQFSISSHLIELLLKDKVYLPYNMMSKFWVFFLNYHSG